MRLDKTPNEPIEEELSTSVNDRIEQHEENQTDNLTRTGERRTQIMAFKYKPLRNSDIERPFVRLIE